MTGNGQTQTEYMREWRTTHPDAVARARAVQCARDRAMRALARRHPADFDAIYAAELRKAGLR